MRRSLLQRGETNVSTTQPDLVIIGGGIAGAALAIVARRSGLDVQIVERTARFHDRIRGETIHPWGVTFMRKLDLLDLAENGAKAQRQEYWQTIRNREVQTPSRWADHFPDAPYGLGFSHVELQDAFLAEAQRLGAVIWRPATATPMRDDNDQIVVQISRTGATTSLYPRLLVGADGANSATRTWLGGERHDDPVHHALGGVLTRGLGLASDRIHQAFIDGGFAFVSPMSDDRARVYLVVATDRADALQRDVSTGDRIVEQFLAATPEDYTSGSWEVIGPAGFFPNATGSVTIPPTDDVVLIGDASGRNDPSQGHGLSLAFHDVAVLSDLLATLPWPEVPDAFHQRKAAVFETLRQHAHWNERQATETGPEIDVLKERIRRAREIDPTAAGFAGIFATGPMGLTADDAARRAYLGEDLPDPATAVMTGL